MTFSDPKLEEGVTPPSFCSISRPGNKEEEEWSSSPLGPPPAFHLSLHVTERGGEVRRRQEEVMERRAFTFMLTHCDTSKLRRGSPPGGAPGKISSY